MITTFLLAIVSAMIVNNIILMQFLGICPFLGVSKSLNNSIGMSGAVGFVLLISSIITYGVYYLILVPLHIEFMITIAFILIIASLVQLVEMFLKKYSSSLYKSLGVFLPLITTNCAILGVANVNITSGANFGVAMSTAIGSALGFALVIITFSAARVRLDSANIPAAFKGVPVSLAVASFMSVAFAGFSGVI